MKNNCERERAGKEGLRGAGEGECGTFINGYGRIDSQSRWVNSPKNE